MVTLTSGADSYTAPDNAFYLAYRGSVAHGMYVKPDNPDSIDDIDLMGFVFGELKDYFGLGEWGSRGTREVKAGRYDVVLYEARKAVTLLLQGNPNIMSMLWVKPAHQIVRSPAAKALIDNRHLFVGKHVYHAFAGYAYQQLEKMETRDPADLREYLAVTAELKYRGAHPNHKGEEFPMPAHDTGESRDVSMWDTEKLRARLTHYHKKGENLGYMGEKRKQLVLRHGYDSKNAAHLIRLLRMCVEFMKTGEMIVDRPDAAELLDIKAGKWSIEDVKRLSTELFAESKSARDASKIPEEPNREEAERLLVQMIKTAVLEKKI